MNELPPDVVTGFWVLATEAVLCAVLFGWGYYLKHRDD